jgi:hypothetical protein
VTLKALGIQNGCGRAKSAEDEEHLDVTRHDFRRTVTIQVAGHDVH